VARIRNRITLTVVVVITAALFCAALLALQFMENNQMQHLRDSLLGEARLMATELTTTASDAQPQMARQSAVTLGRAVFLLSRDNRVLVSATPTGHVERDIPWPFDHPAPTVGQAHDFQAALHGQDMVLAAAPVSGNPAVHTVVIATPLEPEYARLLTDWRWLAVEFAGVGVLFILIGYLWARRIASPLEHIAATTEQIASGDVRKRVPYWGQDEYGRISTAINSLTGRLLEQMDDLSQEKSKVEGIIKHMGSGVLVVDRSGVILVANETATAMLGGSQTQLVGQTHWVATTSLRISELIDTVLLKGHPLRKEVVVNNDINVELFVTPIFGANEEVVGAVAVLHDVTQFRRVERMRTEFVANVSHELRTPITAVKGFAETLLDGALENPDLCRQFVQIIYDESERLSHLVLDLLELSKMESGHSVFRFTRVNISELVDTAAARLQNQATQSGIDLFVHTPESPVFADVAPERITQVLINLIGNAIAYTPAPGRIDVSVLDADEEVTVEVADTGIGIPKADIPRIFERFYRVDKDRSRNTGGTGLGLAIVKHILEAHRGTIKVTSEVGRGSTFSFTLPKRQPERNPDGPSNSNP
jgi:two-component system, OmpR family, phosphate regulon sensor histidine kinase PhoR